MLAAIFAFLAFSSPPGALDPGATRSAVCTPGYARSHRRVPYSERDTVYDAYGLRRGHRAGYVIDHFVPLELGGSNNRANLWPQTRAEAKRKDLDEGRLRAEVCSNAITLDAARAEMIRLWHH